MGFFGLFAGTVSYRLLCRVGKLYCDSSFLSRSLQKTTENNLAIMVKKIDLSDDNLANLMLDQGVRFVPDSFPETLSPAHAAWHNLLYSDRMRPNLVVWEEEGRFWF